MLQSIWNSIQLRRQWDQTKKTTLRNMTRRILLTNNGNHNFEFFLIFELHTHIALITWLQVPVLNTVIQLLYHPGKCTHWISLSYLIHCMQSSGEHWYYGHTQQIIKLKLKTVISAIHMRVSSAQTTVKSYKCRDLWIRHFSCIMPYSGRVRCDETGICRST